MLQYKPLLTEQYPSHNDIVTELINLNAILNLPKPTEHFISDLHGEFDAFNHLLNSCSGEIASKIDLAFPNLTGLEKDYLAKLIYYPEDFLNQLARIQDEDYYLMITQLVELTSVVSFKYTKSKIRKAIDPHYQYVIEELLYTINRDQKEQQTYINSIIDQIISLNQAPSFIIELTSVIKRLTVDKLHVIGDIFDRGPHPDKIIDSLIEHHNVDIQWGNHDIEWMGAGLGHPACICYVIRNTIKSEHYSLLENSYGISLRTLEQFADKNYLHIANRSTRMIRAITIILFKLEHQIISNNPDFGMDDRKLLEQINYETNTISLNGREYELTPGDIRLINNEDNFSLTSEEQNVIDQLISDFTSSQKLARHIEFLHQNGSLALVANGNLLLHGCVPFDQHNQFATVLIEGDSYYGKGLVDKYTEIINRAFEHPTSNKNLLDYFWYLWCGKLSPLFGKEKMTVFEREFITDPTTHEEPKNNYYKLINDEYYCQKILNEFGATKMIINGHVPVNLKAGEIPIHGNQKLVFIDGGFNSSYHSKTGIAGFTLIFNSHGLRLVAHDPFNSKSEILQNFIHVSNETDFKMPLANRLFVRDTDVGIAIKNKISILKTML